MSFIGQKEIRETKETGELTPGGVAILEVEYADGSKEWFSSLMHDVSVTEKACDLTELRAMQVTPIVAQVLATMRDWGMKTGATPYFSALLNQSLNYNLEEATKELWGKHMPRPLDLDDVDMVTVDRVLSSIAPRTTLKDVLDAPDAK